MKENTIKLTSFHKMDIAATTINEIHCISAWLIFATLALVGLFLYSYSKKDWRHFVGPEEIDLGSIHMPLYDRKLPHNRFKFCPALKI